MSSQHYSPELTVCAQDFLSIAPVASGIDAIEQCDDFWREFSSLARENSAGLSETQLKALWLVLEACLIKPNPKDVSNPFRPQFITRTGRSAIPSDFSVSDLHYFEELAPHISKPSVRARLFDILWLERNPRNRDHARFAIEAYLSAPLNAQTWVLESETSWQRALSLAKRLQDNSLVISIADRILQAFKKAELSDGFFALHLSELMYENKIKIESAKIIANKLYDFGVKFRKLGDGHRSRMYFEGASGWHGRSGNQLEQFKSVKSVALSYIAEANKNSSAISSHHFARLALKVLRSIPRAFRQKLRIESLLVRTQTLVMDYGEISVQSMGGISSPPFDITKIICQSVEHVKEKDPISSLRALAGICSPVNIDDLLRQSIESLEENPLRLLFSPTTLSGDGRVIAQGSGVVSLDALDASNAAVRSDVFIRMNIQISLTVLASVLPALQELQCRYPYKFVDFFNLCRHCAAVPAGREWLFAKALSFGFEGDFSSAIHLIGPQIENMVRVFLKQRGVVTTNTSPDGIEKENGLSSLMEHPEVNEVFGQTLALEIQYLFCIPGGPNLRNEIAHGLLNSDETSSHASIYGWWLLLRIVMNNLDI